MASPKAPAPSDAERQLRRAALETLKDLDAPCSCRFARIPCDCEQYRRTGDCGHKPSYPTQCEHLRNAPQALSLAEVQELIQLSGSDEYDEPPDPPTPALFMDREHKVAVYAMRHAAGYGLRLLPGDLEHEDCDEVSVAVGNPGNGQAEFR